MAIFSKQNQAGSPKNLTPRQASRVPSPRYRKRYHKLIYSTYFRIILSAILIFLLFVTAFLIAYQSETRKKASEDYEKAIPDAEILLPTPEITSIPAIDTSSWNIYTSEEYGLTFKYPDLWTLEDDTRIFEQGDMVSVVFVGEAQKVGSELFDGGSFSVSLPIETTQNIKTWVKDYYSRTTTNSSITEYSEKTVGNTTYQKVYTCGLGCFNYYNLKREGNVYQILTFAGGPDEAKHQQTVDQILSTFEFLEE